MAATRIISIIGRKHTGRKIIEKEKRSRALHENVVNAVIYKVLPDRVVNTGIERDFQFRADAVC